MFSWGHATNTREHAKPDALETTGDGQKKIHKNVKDFLAAKIMRILANEFILYQ